MHYRGSGRLVVDLSELPTDMIHSIAIKIDYNFVMTLWLVEERSGRNMTAGKRPCRCFSDIKQSQRPKLVTFIDEAVSKLMILLCNACQPALWP